MSIVSSSFGWYRWLLFRMTGTETDRMLTLSMVFSMALVAAHIAYTGYITFLSLVWNLFLAWLPYMISSWLQQQATPVISRWKFAAIAFV